MKLTRNDVVTLLDTYLQYDAETYLGKTTPMLYSSSDERAQLLIGRYYTNVQALYDQAIRLQRAFLFFDMFFKVHARIQPELCAIALQALEASVTDYLPATRIQPLARYLKAVKIWADQKFYHPDRVTEPPPLMSSAQVDRLASIAEREIPLRELRFQTGLLIDLKLPIGEALVEVHTCALPPFPRKLLIDNLKKRHPSVADRVKQLPPLVSPWVTRVPMLMPPRERSFPIKFSLPELFTALSRAWSQRRELPDPENLPIKEAKPDTGLEMYNRIYRYFCQLKIIQQQNHFTKYEKLLLIWQNFRSCYKLRYPLMKLLHDLYDAHYLTENDVEMTFCAIHWCKIYDFNLERQRIDDTYKAQFFFLLHRSYDGEPGPQLGCKLSSETYTRLNEFFKFHGEEVIPLKKETCDKYDFDALLKVFLYLHPNTGYKEYLFKLIEILMVAEEDDIKLRDYVKKQLESHIIFTNNKSLFRSFQMSLHEILQGTSSNEWSRHFARSVNGRRWPEQPRPIRKHWLRRIQEIHDEYCRTQDSPGRYHPKECYPLYFC